MPESPTLAATLDPATRAVLERESLPVQAPPGTVLFRPGDPCKGFLMLRQGRVRVDLVAEDGHALLLYRVAPGEACAITTSCLFAGEAYSAEGRAETAIEGMLLPGGRFAAMVADLPGFRAFVMAGFAARLAALMGRIEELSFRSVDRRLAAWLLAQPGGQASATQEAIGVEIGTAREVVSRRLAALAKAGLLRVERGAVTVLDRAGLASLRDGDGAA